MLLLKIILGPITLLLEGLLIQKARKPFSLETICTITMCILYILCTL